MLLLQSLRSCLVFLPAFIACLHVYLCSHYTSQQLKKPGGRKGRADLDPMLVSCTGRGMDSMVDVIVPHNDEVHVSLVTLLIDSFVVLITQ